MLKGRRILIVEDEALVAVTVVDILVSQGAIVLGPAPSIGNALALIETTAFDMAILDVNLRGESIEPVAHRLFEHGTPFVFATGYGRNPPGPWVGAPTLGKPFTEVELLRAVQQALSGT
jgi:CheY-like chemotaxis protein